MRVTADDFNDVPTLHPVEAGTEVRFVTAQDFISVQEESAEPLFGTRDETLLPAGGTLIMYGDGGAGKTTLTIDAAAHLCSGTSWLGIDVDRPVRMTLIENEGPRGKFREKLEQKANSWNGNPPFQPNLHVLEEPWTRFTLDEEAHRMALAIHVSQTSSDVVVMGPLATLGMVGGGTPDEINTFNTLLEQTRELVTHPIAFWIVHHENKSGDISGAWERLPDTLVHVQAQGNGHTRLVWRKARWSSENHGKGIDLLWAEGRSFEVVEKKERDPWADMEAAFRHVNGWRTAKEAGKLISLNETQAKKVLAELTRRGVFEYQKGPHGRSATAQCWRLKDGVEGALDDSAHLGAPTPKTVLDERGAPLRSPVRGAAGGSAPAEDGATAPAEHSAPKSSTYDDIPF